MSIFNLGAKILKKELLLFNILLQVYIYIKGVGCEQKDKAHFEVRICVSSKQGQTHSENMKE
jgi:hypothetical protein